MAGTKVRDGLYREDMRDRLRVLGLKARADARSLTLDDLDEICTLVAVLAPSHFVPPPPAIDNAGETPVEPIVSDSPRLEVQLLLRQAQAMEHIAVRLGELVRLKEEDVIRQRWATVPFAKERDV